MAVNKTKLEEYANKVYRGTSDVLKRNKRKMLLIHSVCFMQNNQKPRKESE